MILAAAAALIVVVLGGTVSLILLDMQRRPAASRFDVVKEWQAIIGAVLGFLGAAGVLVLSNELQGDQRAMEEARAQKAIGYGLALEAEQLASDLSGIMGIVTLIHAQDAVADPTSVCVQFIDTVQRVLPTKTPVYDAVLSHLVDFGDQNLSIFVRFFANYGDLVKEAENFDRAQCQINAANEVNYVRSKVRSTLLVYDVIADAYRTIPQQVPSADENQPGAAAMTTPSPDAPAATVEPATPPADVPAN